MRSRKPASTARRLIKVASLGLAGLIAGLLAGCSSDSLERFSAWRAGSDLTATRHLQNLDYRRTPEIRRAPVPHRTQPVNPQRTTTQAYLSEIDAAGHHYDAHGGQ